MVAFHRLANSPTSVDVATTNRGVMGEEVVAHGMEAGPLPRWGVIIGGSVLVMALLLLSSSLGYSCGVPAFGGGVYGWGAGIWSVLTAGIAFGAGGMLAGRLMHGRHGALAGLFIWALTIPLIYVLFLGGVGGLGHTLVGSDIVQMTLRGDVLGNQPTLATQHGAAWGSFISMAVGLIAAVVGGYAGSECEMGS